MSGPHERSCVCGLQLQNGEHMEASKREEILQQIDELRRMGMSDLRVRYREVAGATLNKLPCFVVPQ